MVVSGCFDVRFDQLDFIPQRPEFKVYVCRYIKRDESDMIRLRRQIPSLCGQNEMDEQMNDPLLYTVHRRAGSLLLRLELLLYPSWRFCVITPLLRLELRLKLRWSNGGSRNRWFGRGGASSRR